MIPKPNPSNRIRRLLLGAFVLPFLTATLFAQTVGTVTGRVFDEGGGKSLEGAIVRVLGTNAIDYTTNDGRYSVTVPAGTHTIEVEYLGLDTFTQQVTVTAGTSSRIDVPLKSTVLQLDSFIVQESVRGHALAINQQKVASGIVNIVSEETFGQMVDNNIGFAMQRLPGISVNEGQDGAATGFNIRGIEGAYNSFQIDGNRAPNSGTTSRAFNATQFDASGVSNIEVIKAPTPDRDGDAIGGIVNVVSRSAFERDGRAFKLNLAGVYSDLPKKWGHAATLQYSDIFSVGGGEKNLGISTSLSSNRTNRYSINADMDWIQVTPANNPQLDLDQYGDFPVWFMESTHWEYDTRITDTMGINGSIDFRIDESNSFYVRPAYSGYERNGTAYETDINIDTRFQNTPTGRKTYAELTPSYGRGTANSEATIGYIGTDDHQTSDLYSLNFGGRHERGESLLTWDLFYSHNKITIDKDNELNMEREPDDPPYILEYIIHDISRGMVEINVLQGPPFSELLMDEGELELVTAVKEEDIYSARLDWERKFLRDAGAFTFKTGAKYRSSAPKFDRTTIIYEMDDEFDYSLVTRPNPDTLLMKPKHHDVHPHLGVALLASNPELFELNEGASLNNSNLADYDAKEETSAAYVMGTYRFGRHTIIGGVRMEKNEWSSVRKDVDLATMTVTPRNVGDEYTFWLPGLHLRHELTRNLILRESYNKSYGRPNLAQLTRGRTIALNGNITDGNSNLDPAVSDNFEVQLEYYTANSGLYSVGVFYKDVKDFTFTRISRFNELDANGDPIPVVGGTFQYSVPQNGATAENMGVELIARQRLVFLPGVLRNFSGAVSATFTETDAFYPHRTIELGGDGRTGLPLPGFSDYLFTASLEYAHGNFFARADYRYRNDYVEGLGANVESDEFFSAEEKVDLEVRYQLRKGLSVFAYGTNLTDRPQVSYQGFRPFVEDASMSGRKYTIGMEYRF